MYLICILLIIGISIIDDLRDNHHNLYFESPGIAQNYNTNIFILFPKHFFFYLSIAIYTPSLFFFILIHYFCAAEIIFIGHEGKVHFSKTNRESNNGLHLVHQTRALQNCCFKTKLLSLKGMEKNKSKIKKNLFDEVWLRHGFQRQKNLFLKIYFQKL